MTGKSRLTELVVLASAVSIEDGFYNGVEYPWIIHDELQFLEDLAEQQKEKQEKAQKNYLSMMPKYNGGKK